MGNLLLQVLKLKAKKIKYYIILEQHTIRLLIFFLKKAELAILQVLGYMTEK